MSPTAIEVSGLGKSYRLAGRRTAVRYRTLQEEILGLPARLRGLGRPAAEEFWALRDVNFSVREGEVLGVIGRNGAGKSTLLKLLARITEPSAGAIDLYGRVGSLLEVGTGFHPELTGRENIYLSGAILGMRRAEIRRRFDAIVAFAEVERFLETPVKHYSSGMYMRLAFAVAAHLEPEILLVDEVLAVGDAAFQRKCLGKMGEVARSGRTVLFVSHQMGAVAQLCTRVLLLDQGRVVSDSADVAAAIRRYLAVGAAHAGTWEAPGDGDHNPYFSPLRLQIVSAEGAPLPMPLANNTPAWVEITAEITRIDPALTIGYALSDDQGQTLYWSYQTDGPEDRWPQLAPGRCVLRSRLPARLLNEGSYRIELIGGLHHRQWLFEPGRGGPTIDLRIEGGLSDSPYWIARRPGLLAPVIAWEVRGQKSEAGSGG